MSFAWEASGGGRTQVGEVAGEDEVSGMEAVRGQNETRGQVGKSLNLQEGGGWSVVSFSLSFGQFKGFQQTAWCDQFSF